MFQRIPSITTTELEKLDRPVIIDVRETHEYKGGHIPKAKNVPLGQIAAFSSTEPVYVICASGMRSKRAAKILRKNGVEVTNVRGGMMAWQGLVKGGIK
ncbi:rhodanese-like domain-containing protein [Listeria floridensis FSL S10-1187]|uniref:Rhodanese-like domain-containing protein n=1 Tax=Listeria floridensis FSL S10-1187 TaxID=1265817 RepID=A0ABP3B1A5_9LIST|nr:rhodanese-like domain-containing protein [Listeria floridensis]EUJ33653.1 rhodanese-like domain-containing protein [Listeria floridensis FSL S10-1187]